MCSEGMFDRFIGVDYSGADAPTKPLDRLVVYCANGHDPPYRVNFRKDEPRWGRQQLAEWLVDQLKKPDVRTIVGIDHGFSFPIYYFDQHQVKKQDWDGFLVDFRDHWPTHKQWVRKAGGVQTGKLTNDDVRNHPRHGDPTWKRLTDELTMPRASSVFNFNAGPRNVAHSTHAGLPWLLHVRKSLRGLRRPVYFWPFDWWRIPEGLSVVAEVYPSLWSGRVESGMVGDDHDAYSVAAWLSHTDREGLLRHYFEPELSLPERRRANTEGWILGVLGYIRLGVGQDVVA